MATKTKTKTQTETAKLKSQLERYEAFFGELDSFINFVREERVSLETAVAAEAEAKAKLEAARDERRQIEGSIAGAKESLYRLVEPGATKFMPLFDRMEPADPEKHGEHASEWRKKPIAALRLSPIAAKALVDADIIVIGQLQDAVLESPHDWYDRIDGINPAMAAAIVDKLNDFVFRDGGK
tara:strand:+ start:1304 stop:1849 length:546 start_codon:yes stop_codon:yes gene_type:complete